MPEIKPGFSTPFQPERTATYQERNEAAHQIQLDLEEREGSLFGEAIENQWLIPAVHRAAKRAGEDSVIKEDPAFAIGEEEEEQLSVEFTREEKNDIMNSRSEYEKNLKVSRLREDRERHGYLAAHGIKGVAAELTAALLDPVGLALGYITGGSAYLQKGTRLSRMLKGGLSVSAEAAVFEAILTKSDTQRQLDDILTAAGMSLVLGSAIGAITRAKPEFINNVKAADNFDSSIKTSVDNIQRNNAIGDIASNSPKKKIKLDKDTSIEVDPYALHKGVNDYEMNLDISSKRRVPRKQKKALKKSEGELQKDLDDLQDLATTHRAKVMATKGAARTAAEQAVIDSRLGSIDKLYGPKIKHLETKLNEVKEQLYNVSAKRELDEFAALTEEEKIIKVFGKENMLNHVKAVTRQKLKAQKVGKVIDDERIARAKKIQEQEKAAKAEEGTEGKKVQEVSEEEIEPELLYNGSGSTREFLDKLVDNVADKPTTTSQYTFLPRYIRDRVQSLFTTLDNSANLAVRGLNRMLFESPQGGVIPEQTASVMSNMYVKQFKSAIRNRYNDSYFTWSAKRGRGMVKAVLDVGNERRIFDEAVCSQVLNPVDNVDDAVKDAADGFRDGYSLALKTRREAGEAGFEKVKDTRKYMPIIFSNRKMNTAFNNHSEKNIIETLSYGYQTGGFEMKKSIADRLAKMQYIRTMESSLIDSGNFKKVFSEAEQRRFIKELQDAGADQEIIDVFMETKELSHMLDNVSNRAKASMRINIDAEVDGLKVSQLINTNISDLTENYFREAAGGAAMAKKGFRTYESAIQAVNGSQRMGVGSATRADEEAQMLKEGIDMIYGKSIEVDPSGSIEVGTRRLRELTSLLRLQSVGFAQVPEAARMVHVLGLEAVMKSIPAVRFINRTANRKGKTTELVSEPMLRELERHLGYMGEDPWLTGMYTRMEDFGEGAAGQDFTRLMDNALAGGTRVNMITSGFQAIQGGMEKLTARGISHRLTEIIDTGKLMSKNLMDEVGWDDAFVKRLKAHGKHYDNFSGKKIRVLGLDNMEPGLREEVLIGITRMQSRIIQRGMVGDTAPWMNKWLGKTLTQFRSFSIISGEKQLLHDIKGDMVGAASIMMWGSLLSYLTYMTKVNLKSLGEKDPEGYRDRMLTPEMTAWGSFNMLPQTAIVTLGGEALATLGALPESLTSTAKSRGGFRPIGASNVAASVGTVEDVFKTGNLAVDFLTGRDVSESDKRAARSLIPLGRSIGIGQAINASINLIDKD